MYSSHLTFGTRGSKRHMSFHQEMRRQTHIERFSKVGRLKPRGDAANSSNARLQNARTAMLQVLPEMLKAIERFADSDWDSGRADRRTCPTKSSAGRGSSYQAISNASRGAEPCGLLDPRRMLISVHHDLEIIAYGFAYRRDALHVFDHRPADFHFEATQPQILRIKSIRHQCWRF